MIRNYLKTGWRNLWKNKTFSFLNVFGLAIGIACAGMIFLWVEDELDFDQLNSKKDRLYQVEVNIDFGANNFTMASTPRPMANAMKSEIPGIVSTARVSDESQRLLFSVGDKSLFAGGLYADAPLFNMFTFDFVQGNAEKAFPQLYSLVITENMARKFFGDEKNVLGKALRVDNKHDYVVSGVVKDMAANSSLQFEWLAPYEVTFADTKEKGQEATDALDWGSYGPITYVELASNANISLINGLLTDFIHRKSADQKSQTFLFPMKDWRLYNEFANGKPTGSGRIKQVRMLSALAWIILFIACINFMNLATANSQQRAKEVGVRKVLGAGEKGLVMQFIGEALLMSLLASIAATFIMVFALPAFNMLMQKSLTLGLQRPSHIIVLLVITTICGLLAGSYPAFYLSSFRPAWVIKGMKQKPGSAAFIRKGLVVVQFTVSVVFIISTMIVYMQIQHVKGRDLGFKKDQLIQVNPQHDVSQIFPQIKDDLIRIGLIENAAIADHSTLYGGDTDDGFKWAGKSPENKTAIAHRNVSPGFISTSGMKLIAGRNFSDNAGAERSNIIINESMARMMGKESAVGKIIESSRDAADGRFNNKTVIGVVADYVYGNIYGRVSPLIIFCAPPEFQTFIYVRPKPGTDLSQTLAKLAAVMKKSNPGYPFEYEFVDGQFQRMFQNEGFISKVSSVFAVLAIFISCLGLFGLSAYTAEQRTKEIGIRKVLGASVSGIANLLSKDFLQLVAISCLLAFPIAWWIMQDWLRGYEYRISMSWWVFLAAGFGALFIALFTVSFQAIKAALANPVKSLRTE